MKNANIYLDVDLTIVDELQHLRKEMATKIVRQHVDRPKPRRPSGLI